jgi:hypothetical protein
MCVCVCDCVFVKACVCDQHVLLYVLAGVCLLVACECFSAFQLSHNGKDENLNCRQKKFFFLSKSKLAK